MKATLAFLLQCVILMSFSSLSSSSSSSRTGQIGKNLSVLSAINHNTMISASFTPTQDTGNFNTQWKSMIDESSKIRNLQDSSPSNVRFSQLPSNYLSEIDAAKHLTPTNFKDILQHSSQLTSDYLFNHHKLSTNSHHSRELKETSTHWASSDPSVSSFQRESEPNSLVFKNTKNVFATISSSHDESLALFQSSVITAWGDTHMSRLELEDFTYSSLYTSELNTQEYDVIEPSSVVSLEKTDKKNENDKMTPLLTGTQNRISLDAVSATTSHSLNDFTTSKETGLLGGVTKLDLEVTKLLGRSVQFSSSKTEGPSTQGVTPLESSMTHGVMHSKTNHESIDNDSISESTAPNGTDYKTIDSSETKTTSPPSTGHASNSTQEVSGSLINHSQQVTTTSSLTTLPQTATTGQINVTISENEIPTPNATTTFTSSSKMASTSTATTAETVPKPTSSETSPLVQSISTVSSKFNHSQLINESSPMATTDSNVLTTNTVSPNRTLSPANPSVTESTVSLPQANNASHANGTNFTYTSVKPDSENNAISNPDRLEQIAWNKSGCNCSSRFPNALELLLLRKLVPREKTVKSFMSGIKIDDDGYSQKPPVPRSADSQPGNQQAAGVICYDERISITSTEVECPKPTSRKMELQDHHLQQILKNEGKRSVHGLVTQGNIHQIDLHAEVNETTHQEQLRANVRSLLDKQLSFHQNLRQLITEYITSFKTRNVISLTNFLKTYVENSLRGTSLDSWNSMDAYLMCKLNELDINNITSFYDKTELEMLKSESQPTGVSGVERLFETIFYYNYRSGLLLRLLDNLKASFKDLNNTFESMSRTFSRKESSQSHPKWHDGDIKITTSEKPSPSSMSPDSIKSKHKKDVEETDKYANPSNKMECFRLVSDIENGIMHRRPLAPEKKDSEKIILQHNSEATSGESFDSSQVYGTVVSELFTSIFSILKNFTLLETPRDLSFSALDVLEVRLSTLRKDFSEFTHNKRTKRSLVGSTDDVCHDQGSLIPNTDFQLMCSTCVKTTTLGQDFFPSQVTEKTCKNDGSSITQSGSVPVANGCLNEGGRAGGLCQQQTMTIVLLHRNAGKCMKVVSRGQEFITDQWKLITHELRTGCECVVDQNSQFAKYLTFG